MPSRVSDHLWAHFYLLECSYSDSVCRALLTALRAQASAWSEQLRVLATEDDRQPLSVGDQPLLATLTQKRPPRFGLGSWVLRGSYPGLRLYIDGSRSTHAPELNKVSLEIRGLRTVDEVETVSWLRGLVGRFADALPIRYGNVRTNGEYDSTNLERGPGSVRAIGTSFHQSLPGLYWLNVFGPEYIDLIGRDRLLSSPAAAVESRPDNITVLLADGPFTWQTADYRDCRAKVLNHLGHHYFFHRNDPSASRFAPNFGPSKRLR